MPSIRCFFRGVTAAVLPVVAMTLGACSLDKQEMPALSGPSGLGLSLAMTASPDQLPRDGSSQSVITVIARDATSHPIGGQRITLNATGGTLSQDSVTTSVDGRATFMVTAPGQSIVVPGNQIVVSAVPVGQDAGNSIARRISILLVGVSNSTEPVPSFTVSPSTPEVNQAATFDATATTDEGGQCLDVCSYGWNFDDGTTAIGRIVTHAFSVSRSYNVALTVTDGSGLVVTLRKLVTPTAPAEPTVSLTVAPNPPVVGQQATFNAVGIAATGHSIVRYEWDFGDGSTTSTSAGNVTHTYAARGIYAVTVRAIDDLGRAGSTSLTLNLTTGTAQGANATFFVNASSSGLVIFNANESTPSTGAKITTYRWFWGDQTATEDATDPIISHQYSGSGKFLVQLQIIDSAGRTAFTRLEITVP